MSNAMALLLPMAMLLPAVPADESRPDRLSQSAFDMFSSLQNTPEQAETPMPMSQAAAGQELWGPMTWTFQTQVRGRIIIRVTARRPSRNSLVADTRTTSAPRTIYKEKKIGKCVEAKSIAWMQPGNERLIFRMKNRTLISARLNKKCRAKDFYSGFYVERHRDGKICIKRDDLQSRAGSKCKLRSFRELVPQST